MNAKNKLMIDRHPKEVDLFRNPIIRALLLAWLKATGKMK